MLLWDMRVGQPVQGAAPDGEEATWNDTLWTSLTGETVFEILNHLCPIVTNSCF